SFLEDPDGSMWIGTDRGLETAEMEGSYSLSDRALVVKVTTPGLKVAELQASSGRLLGAAAVPLLEAAKEGVWKGWVRYRREGEFEGEWSGEYDLQNAVIEVDGLADKVRIASAAVSIDRNRMTIRRLRARAGKVGFEGEYRQIGNRSRLDLAIESVNAADLERLLIPSLARQQGFFARTLRIGRIESPEWLKTRHLDAALAIEELIAGDYSGSIEKALVKWDGAKIRITNIDGLIENTAIAGILNVDLSGRVPKYSFQGKAMDATYHGGRLEFEGKLETEGLGSQLLAGARAEGTVKGRALTFAPDTELRTVSGQFEVSVGASGPKWRLQNVEASQGTDLLRGEGGTQADGKLVVELMGRKPLRVTAIP
ncbi:MAG: hypothetical protein ABI823_03810, partial [Bryobacteraceae bacterium]